MNPGRTSGLRPRLLAGLCLLATMAGCSDEYPTSPDEDLLPITARTFEIVIPWDDFASDLQVFGGYGRTSSLSAEVVARDFEGVLNARPLVRFGAYPRSAQVRDTTGTSVTDVDLTFVGGRVFAVIDTLELDAEEGAEFAVSDLVTEWDPATATWERAVDSIGEEIPWGEPGAGDAEPVASAEWNPAEGDSVFIPLDSATVAEWSDTLDVTRGFRLELETPGRRLELTAVGLQLTTRPSVNPDTLLTLPVTTTGSTFIYDPTPEPVAGEIRVGGSPSWRSVFGIDLPAAVNGPPGLCQAVGCPYTLDPDDLNAAFLVLRTRTTQAGFQPNDSVRLDVRPVLAPDRLPKSPLGESLVGTQGVSFPPAVFGEEAGEEIQIPVSTFVEDLLRGETEEGLVPPGTIGLLSFFEPSSLGFANLAGPGEEGEPFVRMIVTTSDTVRIR